MTKDEIIAELQYLIQRGVPDNVAIVLLVLCGALYANQISALADMCAALAIQAKAALLDK